MLPEGFILRMQSLLGEEYAAFSASFDRPLCTGLRLNPLKTGFTGDLSRFSLSPVPWCPTGYVYDAAADSQVLLTSRSPAARSMLAAA